MPSKAKRLSDLPFVATCQHCGGLHYGSNGCPYNETICDICHKTLLQHTDLCFCEGGKTEHNPRQKYCTCESCVKERMDFSRKIKAMKRPAHAD